MNTLSSLEIVEGKLTAEIHREVERIVAGLPADSSCLVTGSIIEGLGNKHSDIDVYVVHGSNAGANSIAVGLRESRYIDCEYMTVGTLEKVASRIEDTSWRAFLDLPFSTLDRFYRVAIAVPARVTEPAAAVLGRFDRELGCRALANWSLLAAFGFTARGACLLGEGSAREAGVLLRAAALWRASSLLAVDGEGYPSRKWVAEKAARRFGRDSSCYRELVDEFLRPEGGPADLLERLRTGLDVPAELHAVLGERRSALSDEVGLITGPDRDVLVRGRATVAEIGGVASAVCRALAAGSDWTAATAELADRLDVRPAEAAFAAWHETATLRSAGFLLTL